MTDEDVKAANEALVESMVRQLRDCASVGDEMTLEDACLLDDAADWIAGEPARIAAARVERDEVKAEVARLVTQIEQRGGAYGHIYYGPDCLLCGHFGPTDEPEMCDAEKRFASLKARVAELERERDEASKRVAELGARRFPVLDAGFSVPWSLVAPFERQAQRNHDQTLERLAERGGLDPVELWAVMHGMTWKDRAKFPSKEDAKAWALSLADENAALKARVAELESAAECATAIAREFDRRNEESKAERDEAVAALRGLLRDEWYTYEGNLEASGRASVDDLNAARAVLAKYPEGR